jgi:putative membrane protein
MGKINNKGGVKMIGLIVRFIVSVLVLMVTGWLLPGFEVSGFIGALIAAVVIAVLGYLVESIFGKKVSPQNRGIIGFITSAAVIYLAKFIIPDYLSVTIVGALLAALVIGIIDAFVPTELR